MNAHQLNLSYTSFPVTAANLSGMLRNNEFGHAPAVGDMLNLFYMNSSALFLAYVLNIESEDPSKEINVIWVPNFQGHVVGDYFKVRFVQNACSYIAAPGRYSPGSMNYLQMNGADAINQHTILFTGGTGVDTDVYRVLLALKDFIRRNQYLTPALNGNQTLRYMTEQKDNVGLIDLTWSIAARQNGSMAYNNEILLVMQDLKTLHVSCIDAVEAARLMLNINYIFEKRGGWPGSHINGMFRPFNPQAPVPPFDQLWQPRPNIQHPAAAQGFDSDDSFFKNNKKNGDSPVGPQTIF
jgi:hypothetical protein